jgi:hypothetical protein
MLDNFINGNRSDVRANLAEMPVKDACLAVVDLIEDLIDQSGEDPGDNVDLLPSVFENIRQLLEAM